MAFGEFDQRQTEPMSEINVTPLVDVMLVLLVIFLVTAPLFTHAVRVDLPQARAEPTSEKPENVALAIDAHSQVYWNREAITAIDLRSRLAAAAAREPQPEIHLYADRDTRYQTLAEVMAAAQTAGLGKVGFVIDPTGKH